MKTRNVVIMIIAIGGLFSSVLVWKYAFREAKTNVSSEKAAMEITITRLLEDFTSDENQANSIYLDKVILVKGTVASISEDTLGISVYLKEINADAGVLCSFDKKAENINKLKVGQVALIKGICSGYLMDVVLNRCSIEMK